MPNQNATIQGLHKQPFNISLTDEYLDSIRPIFGRQINNLEKRKGFLKQADTIDERKKSLTLNMAVIGQFSSGKSTFINAILRYRLLKAQNAVSTAAATFIKQGNLLSLKVTFHHDYIIESSENDYGALQHHLERFHNGRLNDRRDLFYFIELMTTDVEVAATITNLEIEYPTNNDFLRAITIIDTPGLFAGDDSADTHESITQSVIDNRADLAIVLIPSYQAMSRSLIDFLGSLPHCLLNRCVFIISRMDMVEAEDEREGLIVLAKKQLKEKLALKEPQVLSCSAVAMLPGADKTIIGLDGLEHWQSSFLKLEETLKDMLQKNRPLIILEKLRFLMQNLINELSEELSVEEKKLLEEEAVISSQAVESIEATLNKIFTTAKEKVKNKETEIINKLSKKDKHIKNVKDSATRKVNNTGSNIYSTYENIESELHKEIREELDSIGRNVNIGIAELSSLCETLSEQFEQQFRRNYSALKFLGTSINVARLKVSNLQFPAFNFSSYKNMLKKQNEDATSGRNKGAVIGGLIGLLGGPIGVGFGAWLGSKIGKDNAKEPLYLLQAKAIGQLNDEIEIWFSSSIDVIKTEITKTVNLIIKNFKTLCDNHVTAYEKDIQKQIEQHKKKSSAIKERIRLSKQDKKTLLELTNNLNT